MRKLFALFLLLIFANKLFAQSSLEQQYQEAQSQCKAQAKIALAQYDAWADRQKKFKIRFEALPKQEEEVNRLIKLVGAEENRMKDVEGKPGEKEVGFFLHNSTRWPNPYMTYFDNANGNRGETHWVYEPPSSNAWKFFFNNYLAIKNKATQAVMAYKQESLALEEEAKVVIALEKKWTELGQEHLKRKKLVDSLYAALIKERKAAKDMPKEDMSEAAKIAAETADETLKVAKDASLGVAASSLTFAATETNKFFTRLEGVTSKLLKADGQIDALKAKELPKDAWGVSEEASKQINYIRKIQVNKENAADVEKLMIEVIEKVDRSKKGFSIMEQEFGKVATSYWSNVPSGGAWGYVFANATLDAHKSVQALADLSVRAKAKLEEAKTLIPLSIN